MQVQLGHALGAAKTNFTIAKTKWEDSKLAVRTNDDALKEFCSENDAA
eukprot:COSAG05_NODE_1679_length_4291_cov_102.969704_1_plen_47_part_10